MSSVLVVAAHPDDEVLACGGTIARLVSEGRVVEVLIVAEGATSRDARRDRSRRSEALGELARAAAAANAILGAKVTLHDFPDNRMDSVDLLDVVKVVEATVQRVSPTLVLTHHCGDVNIDHRIVHDAVIAACRPVPGTTVHELLFFETASSTEWRPAASARPFQPNVYYDIREHWETKQRAIEAYASEMRAFPHPRSVRALQALAAWRGASCGVEAAEAFELGRTLR